MDEVVIADRLDQFLRCVQQQGVIVRHEILNGIGAGICRVDNQICLFLDLTCSPAEQWAAIEKSVDELATENKNPAAQSTDCQNRMAA